MIRLFALIVSCIIIFSACQDIVDSDSKVKVTKISDAKLLENQTSNVLQPLKVGNYWVYNIIVYDTSGTVIGTQIDTLTVDKYHEGSQGNWYLLNQGSESGDVLINTDIGLIRYYEGSENNSMILGLYPANTGLSISHKYPLAVVLKDNISNIISSTRTIVTDKFSNLKAPTGTFSGYKYTEKFSSLENPLSDISIFKSIRYYSVNIGLVRMEYYFVDFNNEIESNPKLYMIWELVGYKLN